MLRRRVRLPVNFQSSIDLRRNDAAAPTAPLPLLNTADPTISWPTTITTDGTTATTAEEAPCGGQRQRMWTPIKEGSGEVEESMVRIKE